MGPATAVLAVGGLLYLAVLITLVFHPRNSAIGYAPEQPVPFSHALHAGELGMDCRYCHTTVEAAAHASVPTAETCLNCHKTIFTESAKLLPVRESQAQVHVLVGLVAVQQEDLAGHAQVQHHP